MPEPLHRRCWCRLSRAVCMVGPLGHGRTAYEHDVQVHGSAGEVAKTATTGADTVRCRPISTAGDANDESFTAQMTSDPRYRERYPGHPERLIQSVGRGAAP
jgi:hypothetical protein